MHVGLSNSKGRKPAIQPWYMYTYIYTRNFPHCSIGPSATFVAWKFQSCQEVSKGNYVTERVVASVFGGFHIFVVYAPYCEVETRSWHWGTRSLGWEVSLLRRLAETHGWVLGLAWYCMLPYWIAFPRASRGTVDEDIECVTPYNTDLLSLWHLSSWQHVIHHQEMLNSHSVFCAHIELSLYYLQLFLTPLLLNRPGLLKPHGHLLRF